MTAIATGARVSGVRRSIVIAASACAAAAIAGAVIAVLLTSHGHTAQPKVTVATCTADIVKHPVNGPWPMCKGLSQAQLAKATIAAMSQGARG